MNCTARDHKRLWLGPVFAILLWSCTPEMGVQCHLSSDCPEDLFCQMGECRDLNDNSLPGHGLLEDQDASLAASGDASAASGDSAVGNDVDERPPHPCPEAPKADAQSVILNEFLANVPMGLDGDANEDGVRHYHDDEFVELVNTGDATVNFAGVTLFSDTTERFVFPTTCVDPHHAVVVFGGLEPGASPPEGEGYQSLVSESWFRYPQGGGRIVVKSHDGQTIADHEYGGHPDGSLNLEPDLVGDTYLAHRDLADDESLFSPGKCANGRPFPTGCIDDETDDNSNEQPSENEDPGEDDDSPFSDSKPGSG